MCEYIGLICREVRSPLGDSRDYIEITAPSIQVAHERAIRRCLAEESEFVRMRVVAVFPKVA